MTVNLTPMFIFRYSARHKKLKYINLKSHEINMFDKYLNKKEETTQFER